MLSSVEFRGCSCWHCCCFFSTLIRFPDCCRAMNLQHWPLPSSFQRSSSDGISIHLQVCQSDWPAIPSSQFLPSIWSKWCHMYNGSRLFLLGDLYPLIFAAYDPLEEINHILLFYHNFSLLLLPYLLLNITLRLFKLPQPVSDCFSYIAQGKLRNCSHSLQLDQIVSQLFNSGLHFSGQPIFLIILCAWKKWFKLPVFHLDPCIFLKQTFLVVIQVS